MSDLAHQSQPRVGVLVTLAVAWKRWRRALADLRSRLNIGRDTDDLYIVALLSAVLVSDLALLIALLGAHLQTKMKPCCDAKSHPSAF
jgi:hypothetical protein